VKHIPLFLALAGLAALGLPATSQAGDLPSCGAHPPKTVDASTKKDIVDTALAAGSFKTLAAALESADLVPTLKGEGPFTVFAPTDAAFAALPAGTVEGLLKDKAALTKILTYHVVAGKVPAAEVVKLDFAQTVEGSAVRVQSDGSGVLIDGARVVQADIEASNGIIHVIDKVILPRKDIVDTAVEAGSFETLVTAVKAAGLVETLKGKGPFTVFAPAESAFAKLPEGTVASLLDNKPALTNVLTYHVLRGRVLSAELQVGTVEVKTVQGGTVLVTKSKDGSVRINGAKVTTADVLAGNGVIHVIDTVITPEQP